MTTSAQSADFRTAPHSMNRVDVSTGMDFDQFLTAFEKAAPPVDPTRVKQIAESGGTWDDVKAAVAINAPNDLMVYWKFDIRQGLALAGHSFKAVEYLLGNHVIAETMFRHDTQALLYAPLRVLLYSDADANAVFAIDRPSAVFAGFGIPEITKVGEGLDQKVAKLLRIIGVNADQAFGQ
jgi:uncharacterized protein (DUF302 family)